MIPLRDANPTRRTPVVTLGLILLCVVAFVLELAVLATDGSSGLEAFVLEHGVVPAEVSATIGGSGDPLREAGDILTSLFLHAGWLHLAGNMLYLWIFGNNIEDRLGRLGFALFYLVGGAVAALAQVAIDPGSTVPLVGASGAIAATLGAYLVLFPGARIVSLVFLGFFYQLIAVPAVLVLGFWFLLQLIDGVTSLGADTVEGGVAVFAHIGGFVMGLVVGAVLRRRRADRGGLGAGPGVG